jgi:hypothetical protein
MTWKKNEKSHTRRKLLSWRKNIPHDVEKSKAEGKLSLPKSKAAKMFFPRSGSW